MSSAPHDAERVRKTSALALLAVLALGCDNLFVPGKFPTLSAAAPLVPEPVQCGAAPERFVADKTRDTKIIGAADFHNHQFSYLGFGGRYLWGKAFDENGISHALSVCGVDGACLDKTELMLCREVRCRFADNPEACRAQKCDNHRCDTSGPHGRFGWNDPAAAFLGEGFLHSVHGYPEFQGWPNYNTYSHQQVYHRWLRRAFDGGLKLIVMHAVSSEALCQLTSPGGNCNDMKNVKLQLQAARDLEKYIDYQNDCKENGNGWYRIARSPAQARQIIKDGAMAVVLGIEVDTLFDCHEPGVLGGHQCTEDEVRSKIAYYYYEEDVRHVFPVHLFDNGFGGAAASQDFFNLGNLLVNRRLFDVRDCSDDYAFRFGASDTLNGFVHTVARKLGLKYAGYPEKDAHCNNQNISDLGKVAIDALMKSKMIIDVDHMSTFMRASVLKRAEQCKYPGLVSGHSGFTELYDGQQKHEGQLTPREVAKLVAAHGLLAPILHQGGRKEVHTYVRPNGEQVTADCGSSAESFKEAYLYAVDHKGTGTGVGFGSDLNGLAGMPRPRFGPYACGGDGETKHPRVTYPIKLYGDIGAPMDESQIGTRKFDINEDGFAHIGMFPDFVAELLAVGVKPQELEPLFNSAEAYIELWEATEKEQLACPATFQTCKGDVCSP